ncbi:hypothetical protein Y032_0352g3250 [Ancylostoma ceylanicum]|uniref:Reverse transcriptase domain-containing protein n=1 Tax=Ancylostoma ceylanicum TaxID=53326 RepID=A0A016RWP0_9BILA|nr:hypothetical protein Y032_0352g3250 [Ancylostoma ceylanicum]
MDTPTGADGSLRRKPIKRHCIDPSSSPSGDLDLHAEALLKDESLPPHLKAIISFLLDDRRRLNSLLDNFRELNDEILNLRAENARLRSSADGVSSASPVATQSSLLPCHGPPPSKTSSAAHDEVERARSVVIAGIPECPASQSSVISDLISCDRLCLVTGDFNMPDIKWCRPNNYSATCSTSKSFLEFCESSDLTQHVRDPTHGANILDLVLSSDPCSVLDLRVESPIGTSDHATIHFCLNAINEKPIYILKRDYKSANMEAIKDYLRDIDWYGSFESSLTVDQKYETFIAVLHHVIDLFVPLVKVPPLKYRLPPYLKSLFLKRQQAWCTAKSTGKVEDWVTFRTLTSVFQKKLWKLNNSLEKKVVESRSKTAFFKFLRSRLKQKPKLGPLILSNGTMVIKDNDKAEVLADVFEEAFVGVNDFDPPSNWSFPSYPTMKDSVWFHPDEVYKLLCDWPPSSSVTPDHVPFSFIRNVAPYLVSPLSYLFNLSFMRAEVPSRWRMSYVTPILKKPPSTSPYNFRPVSITSIFARMFEKLLKKRIELHLKEYSIISAFQHGFQKNKSTVTAILQSVNDWTLSLDRGACTDVVYLDFSKAFDREEKV